MDIVNAASAGWQIIKDNGPTSSAQSSYCCAIPKAVAFNKMTVKRHTPFRYLPSLVRWLSLAALCSSWQAKGHNFRQTGPHRNV